MATTVAVITGIIGVLIASAIGYYVANNILGTMGTTGGMWGIALFLVPVIVVAAATGVVISIFAGA